mgnify:CR=1 FL=1
MKYLIVGLGNIGAEYRNTRHNIGFMVLDALAKASNLVFADGRYGATANLSIKGRQLVLLKPSTYMNLSGNAVRYWMQKEKIAIENVLVSGWRTPGMPCPGEAADGNHIIQLICEQLAVAGEFLAKH